ncbi:hypothetical protein GCK32_012076, partial [Trichostrongylus colubriformis]
VAKEWELETVMVFEAKLPRNKTIFSTLSRFTVVHLTTSRLPDMRAQDSMDPWDLTCWFNFLGTSNE